ncbi:16S rRNA (adenine(1518)-N(6)/adenine(1519)-N(6))-dimethyltransferase RsmA [Lutimonas sp.]|uniref:16S rRNA (adenine(1518)-N(6)/adenine(1519)-N(6))- dimethyltransferase RsmA n=1 Tax=Lutimonas sp. TaxID=1872403 RepID=UPI003D9B2468
MSVRAKKHLGQHFLKDENIASKIAESLSFEGYQHVLEIGPGMGVLTKYLLKKDTKTWVVEIDTESIDYLKTHYLHLSDRIINADFLKMDLSAQFKDQPIAIIGNFPYNISSQIVFKTIENREQIPEFSGMFQKEVAMRIAAGPGSKTYGILSVLTQAFYDVSYLFTVPPSVFNPPPKVDSGVIRLSRKKDFQLPVDVAFFFRVVKTAFNQRRKTLRNSLKSFQISDKLKEDVIFAQRPEQLSVEQFIELTKSLEKDGIRDH